MDEHAPWHCSGSKPASGARSLPPHRQLVPASTALCLHSDAQTIVCQAVRRAYGKMSVDVKQILSLSERQHCAETVALATSADAHGAIAG